MTGTPPKGLIPVVFVADTAHQFNQSDAVPVLTHSRLGGRRAGGRGLKTLPYAAGAGHPYRDTGVRCEMVYVALTRAQDALIITVPPGRTDSALKLPALCAPQPRPPARSRCAAWAAGQAGC